MRTSTWRGALFALLPLAAGVACREVTTLEQSNPGSLSAATLYTPDNAQILVNGAIGDF